jgi:hypothetical protein
VFAVKTKKELLCLKHASDTKILRHQKIRGDAIALSKNTNNPATRITPLLIK